MRNILVDTGAIIALLRPSDPLHAAAEQAFAALRISDRLHSTWSVITECAFILRDVGAAYWDWLGASGIAITDFTWADALAIRAWARRYRGREVDFADASLVWLAERVGSQLVLTTAFLDFAVYRTAAGKRFELMIAPRA